MFTMCISCVWLHLCEINYIIIIQAKKQELFTVVFYFCRIYFALLLLLSYGKMLFRIRHVFDGGGLAQLVATLVRLTKLLYAGPG